MTAGTNITLSASAHPDDPCTRRAVVVGSVSELTALWSTVHGVATVLQLGFGLSRDLEDALVDEVIDRVLAGYGA